MTTPRSAWTEASAIFRLLWTNEPGMALWQRLFLFVFRSALGALIIVWGIVLLHLVLAARPFIRLSFGG